MSIVWFLWSAQERHSEQRWKPTRIERKNIPTCRGQRKRFTFYFTAQTKVWKLIPSSIISWSERMTGWLQKYVIRASTHWMNLFHWVIPAERITAWRDSQLKVQRWLQVLIIMSWMWPTRPIRHIARIDHSVDCRLRFWWMPIANLMELSRIRTYFKPQM